MATAIYRTAPRPVQRRPLTAMGVWLASLFFFIVAFPKGGIKAGGVPLTIGYVLTLLLLLTAVLHGKRLSIPVDRLLCYIPCLLLGLWSVLVVRSNGVDSVGFTISYFVSVLYLPLFGLTFFSSLILEEHRERIERTLIWAVRFIVIYGIFLFIFKQTTGRWIEIPYVTVNAADVGQLDDKYINRGGIFKLVSTYNNGNIFGVSLASMAPIYLRLESRRYMAWLLYLAMFLTLSRTVWIAVLLVILLRNLSSGVRPLSLLYLVAGVLLAAVVISGLLAFLGFDTSFLLDSNLGGRAGQLDYLSDIRLIPVDSVSPLPEIVYLGMLKYFGIPGLVLFVLHIVTPSLLLHLQKVKVLSIGRASACLQGLMIYAVVAGADAAFSFIPVMMVFWMVAGLAFWYAHREAGVQGGVHETSR